VLYRCGRIFATSKCRGNICDIPSHVLLWCLCRFHANISALQAKVLDLPDAAWTREYQAVHNAIMTGRTQVSTKQHTVLLLATFVTQWHCLFLQREGRGIEETG
jgi:hypothetical protein